MGGAPIRGPAPLRPSGPGAPGAQPNPNQVCVLQELAEHDSYIPYDL